MIHFIDMDSYSDDDSYGYGAEIDNAAPGPLNWTLPVDEVETVVNLDKARQDTWCKEKSEINFIKGNLTNRLKKTDLSLNDLIVTKIVEETGWASVTTGKTPKKKVKERYDSKNVDDFVLQRRLTCTGRVAFRKAVDADGNLSTSLAETRGYCAHCKKKQTNWYCLTCHAFLCSPAVGMSDAPSLVCIDTSNGAKFTIVNSCWHRYHENAYKH